MPWHTNGTLRRENPASLKRLGLQGRPIGTDGPPGPATPTTGKPHQYYPGGRRLQCTGCAPGPCAGPGRSLQEYGLLANVPDTIQSDRPSRVSRYDWSDGIAQKI